jgi:hypothetical protein
MLRHKGNREHHCRLDPGSLASAYAAVSALVPSR